MLTIHYQGSTTPKIMRKLIAELIAISNEVQWTYHVFDDEQFIGIIINLAEKCEPLSFIINHKGRLIHPAWLNTENPQEAAFFVSTKTNFSTVESHITIVKLLKYIEKKYIVNLNVTDEGDYYETGDKEQLQQKWDSLLKKFDEIAAMLEDNLSDSDKSMTDNELPAKIENIIRNNSNEDSNPAKSGFN